MMDVSRIHQGSCVSIFKSLPAREILHLLCVSRVSSWSLRRHWRFLTGVLVVFNMVVVSKIHQGSCVSIFKSLPAREILHLTCVSRASSWSLRGRCMFLRGVFKMWMSKGYIKETTSIFKSLPSWKVLQFLVSPERHPSVILGVLEDAGGS